MFWCLIWYIMSYMLGCDVVYCSGVLYGVVWCGVVWCVVLCCVVLRCVVLCCVVLRCVVLCCVVLCCVVLSCFVLCCVVLCCVALCCVVLRCVVLCCVVLCLNKLNKVMKGYPSRSIPTLRAQTCSSGTILNLFVRSHKGTLRRQGLALSRFFTVCLDQNLQWLFGRASCSRLLPCA